MSRTARRERLALLTAGAAVLLVLAAPARAEPAVTVLELAPGVGGPQQQGGGAGQEQPDVAVFTSGGVAYVVTVYMSSNLADPNGGPWQCKCSSLRMDPASGPVLVHDQVQLTTNAGSRPCNHPRIASSGLDQGVWIYASNDGSASTRTYVQGINEKCELTTPRLRISEKDTMNESAPDIEHVSGASFVAGYLSAGNNDEDASHAVGLTASIEDDVMTLAKTWTTTVVAPSNIGRPAIVAAGGDRAFFCASQGHQRPPEDGVTCALLDAASGQILHKEMIAKSDPAGSIYYNQPSVARLDDGTVAVQVLQSNGTGKQGVPELRAYGLTAGSFALQASLEKVGQYPVHSAICSGAYGEAGEPHVAVMGASINGLGQPRMQMVGYTGDALTADLVKDNLTIGYYADSGLLANLYGHSPNSGGRDFLRCIGDVKNPGFGVAGGFQPEVETFFVAPYAGNEPGDPKNALFLSFVPGKVTPPSPDTTSAGPGGGASPAGTGPSSGAGGDTDIAVTGCACRGSGPDSPPSGALGLLAAGVSGLVARLAARRRRGSRAAGAASIWK